MSRLRLPLVVCASCLFWVVLGLVIGVVFRHALTGLLLGLVLGLIYVLVGSWASERFPLDAWNATLLENIHAPKLYEMLQVLCEQVDMDVPILYYTTRPEPNAYVVGRRENGPAIVVTNGLTRHLDKEEVQAVMALMIARIATGSMPSWTLASTLAGMPMHLGSAFYRRGQPGISQALWSLLGPSASALAWLAWDENVITAADYHAAHLSEKPGTLQTALAKIESFQTDDLALAGNPATAFLFAVPPLSLPPPDAPLWRRTLGAFPYRSPNAAARAARLLSSKAFLAEPSVPLPSAKGSRQD